MTKYYTYGTASSSQAVEAGDSAANVARRYGMSRQVVAMERAGYIGSMGQQAFLTKKRSYTAAQKLEVLKFMHSQGLSQEEAAIKFGISGSATVWEWERRYLENGMEGSEAEEKRQTAESAEAESTADAV